MEAVTILPNMAQQEPRKTLGLNSYADDAEILLDEPKTVKKTNHFIEANTSEIDLKSLKSECIIPVFAKDNELTISHPAFIETAYDAATSFFNGERIETPAIQVSHVVKGRTPEAIHKPANQLLESDKTIYYERCAFAIDIPTIFETVGGNKLNLSIVGVRAYNRENLYSRKTLERFSVAIGFVNQVCCNMCVFTDGYRSQIEVSSTKDLYRALLELFNQYNPAKHLHLMQSLGNTVMTEHQFVTLLGRMRLYQCLPQGYQKRLPRMLLTDTQINSVARTYISDENFGSFGSELDMWRFYNLLTGANKSSYIDSFLDRSLNATEMAVGISSALHGDERYKWFID
ncbi:MULTISPECIES: DUF3871 family protein [unclassified Bacteroides]|jgi:hypothetical protein|uniref:DUF3871 family protein n=1 Tax=unclassified Bacteroides TaxID=2646097 RepID=UPI000E9B18B6|nr:MULTISPECIES: DUF3871 family protein [unclassified Bacteroides]RGN48623.1 DUF3871 family protein [Bacteroides sp. OM05-12]RHR75595.1 DUF3871 family protein [Bacteroides sp. AF16-49]